MVRRRLRNPYRPKALFGMGTESAILAAAGINVAGQMAAAGLNAKMTRDAAKQQAQSIRSNAATQASAIKLQNENARTLQEQSQAFMKEQNEANREIQKDIQMNLQLLAGRQNVNDRFEASKIAVKYGGRGKRKEGGMFSPQTFLRGGNMPFSVTDGGGVLNLGYTPEGYSLYELFGDNHEQYHKTNSGKYKSGVGLKFANGQIVEGEGTGKRRKAAYGLSSNDSSKGELLLNTPDGGYFISKHTIDGFNPRDAVASGMHPMEAYAIQEQLKDIYGISDDGKKSNRPVGKFKRKLRLAGGNLPTMYPENYVFAPDAGNDMTGAATGIALYTNPLRGKVKYGGRLKAENGTKTYGWRIPLNRGYYPGVTYGDKVWNWGSGDFVENNTPLQSHLREINPILNPNDTTIKNVKLPTDITTPKHNTISGDTAQLIGAGVGALGNLAGAFISSAANRAAARAIGDAQNYAAGLLSNAYKNLQTVDLSNISLKDLSAGHALPAIQAPISRAANKVALVDRQTERRLRNVRRNSVSSASANTRMNNILNDAQDIRNTIYSEDDKQMEARSQTNAEAITKAAMTNAELDTSARTRYGAYWLDMLKYNNDIANERILGSANALSEGNINAANAYSQAQAANGTAWASALGNSTLGFANVLSDMATRKANLNNVLLGANTDAYMRYLRTQPGMSEQKLEALETIDKVINDPKVDEDTKNKYRAYRIWLS